MYGFYVSRGEGRYCDIIHDRAERGDLGDVVWGNHDAVDGELAQVFGAPISIIAWFERAPARLDLHGEACASPPRKNK
jgi:hypothetical protein